MGELGGKAVVAELAVYALRIPSRVCRRLPVSLLLEEYRTVLSVSTMEIRDWHDAAYGIAEKGKGGTLKRSTRYGDVNAGSGS
jgi:hypothetical protein